MFRLNVAGVRAVAWKGACSKSSRANGPGARWTGAVTPEERTDIETPTRRTFNIAFDIIERVILRSNVNDCGVADVAGVEASRFCRHTVDASGEQRRSGNPAKQMFSGETPADFAERAFTGSTQKQICEQARGGAEASAACLLFLNRYRDDGVPGLGRHRPDVPSGGDRDRGRDVRLRR